MREGEDVLTFSSLLFHLNASHFPPSSFVEHLSFCINIHQSLYPCRVKNCGHYLCHVVYRNSNFFSPTDKCQVKHLRVTHETAGQERHRINHSQNIGQVSRSKQKLKAEETGAQPRFHGPREASLFLWGEDLLSLEINIYPPGCCW